jgi:hypothetical protein
MTLDRAELTGAGAAVGFHVALIAALSMSLASVAPSPEPPSMEVELVDEVGLQSASPAPTAPPPPSQAPVIGEAEPNVAPALAPPPAQPRTVPTPQVDAAERRQAQIAARRAAVAKANAAKAAPRVSRIGDDFLQGIEADAPDPSPAKPAARFDARAQASVARLIADQIRPCALQQRELGPGANRIQVTLNLQLSPSGRLKRSPALVRVTGDDGDNAQYVDLVVNQAIASYRQCSPLRLPAELYQTPQGGWANINMKYRVP